MHPWMLRSNAVLRCGYLAGMMLLCSSLASAYLLDNFEFTTDFAGWAIGSGTWVHNPTEGLFVPGSAEATGTGLHEMSQCVDVSDIEAGRPLVGAVTARRDPDTAPVTMTLELFSTSDCSGGLLASTLDDQLSSFTGWRTWHKAIALPAGASSARLTLAVDHGASDLSTFFDVPSLRESVVTNGDFPADLSSWEQTPASSWTWLDTDSIGTPSGSVEGTVASDTSLFLAQCILLDSFPRADTLISYIRVKAMDAGLVNAEIALVFRDDQDCATGTPTTVGAAVQPASTGVWQNFINFFSVPDGATSLVAVVAINPGFSSANSQVRIDDFSIVIGDGIFTDGFESGDTDRW